MGGAFSLYYGLHYGKGLAGIFCLSSFLSDTSKVFEVSPFFRKIHLYLNFHLYKTIYHADAICQNILM